MAGRRATSRGDRVARFITGNLVLTPVPGLGGILLYQAHSRSGLGRLVRAAGGAAPYWALCWAGGRALAHHFLALPQCVAGRRVLDLGAGSGLVGIAALRAGAASVIAAETSSHGRAAAALNAAANGVALEVTGADLLDGPAPAVDLVAAGDLFYDPVLAERVSAFLRRCADAGVTVLVGDPGRAHLPRASLQLVAEYLVGDVGEVSGSVRAGVYAPLPPLAGAA